MFGFGCVPGFAPRRFPCRDFPLPMPPHAAKATLTTPGTCCQGDPHGVDPCREGDPRGAHRPQSAPRGARPCREGVPRSACSAAISSAAMPPMPRRRPSRRSPSPRGPSRRSPMSRRRPSQHSTPTVPLTALTHAAKGALAALSVAKASLAARGVPRASLAAMGLSRRRPSRRRSRARTHRWGCCHAAVGWAFASQVLIRRAAVMLDHDASSTSVSSSGAVWRNSSTMVSSTW